MKFRALFHVSIIVAVLFFASRISALSNVNQDSTTPYDDGGAHVAWFKVDDRMYVCIGDGCVEVPIEYLCEQDANR